MRAFRELAINVAQRDKIIIENGAKINDLAEEVKALQKNNEMLDESLGDIVHQQEELNTVLLSLQNEALQVSSATQTFPADEERDQYYTMAEDLNKQVDDMGQNLDKLTKQINEAQRMSKDDPVQQIVEILNGHLTTLQWIDQNAASLQNKLQILTKKSQTAVVEQERLRRSRT